jgi:uncharacterized protein with von Willebrand factor type A (vWA) domain
LVRESTLALAMKCEEFDPDGITVYTFANRFKRYDRVNAAKVAQIFQENEPVGGTNLTAVLQDAFNQHFQQNNAKNEIILVITDGEPDDRKSVFETIVQATKKMSRDEEISISFVQIGNDSQASQFLKALDDQMLGVGAKFDIVDTINFDDLEDITLTEVLMNAIMD